MKKLLFSYLLLSLIYLFGTLSTSYAQFPGGINVPGLGGGSGKSSAIDLKAGKNELVKTFFISFENYAQALSLLSESLGLDAESKKIMQALNDSKNINTNEADRLANSIKATSEVSKQVEEKLKVGNLKLDVKAKEKYAKSIPFVAKGLIGTLELRPKSQQMLSGIQANPIQAVSDLGPFAKAIPEVPNYIATIVSITKLVVSGAEANNIEVKEVKSTLGKF
jgi:hypothetical protein